ncbi:MAG TPA: hypothetical protein VFA33_06215 [Bryobacteraceae bacterium]|nr:hypothetical protein [Bryobacteraceae bacterium]
MSSAVSTTNWFFVAHHVLHLTEVEEGRETWWCVDRNTAPGDRAFIYRPLKGVCWYFEILEHIKPDAFCSSFGMGTARVKILRVFDPPISAKQMKSSSVVKDEGFVRRNFQGKAFVVHSKETPKAMLSLARKNERAAK